MGRLIININIFLIVILLCYKKRGNYQTGLEAKHPQFHHGQYSMVGAWASEFSKFWLSIYEGGKHFYPGQRRDDIYSVIEDGNKQSNKYVFTGGR